MPTCNAPSEEVCEGPHHHNEEPNEESVEIPTISFSSEDYTDSHDHPARSQTPLPGASSNAGLAQRAENRSSELSAPPSQSKRADGREKLTLSGDSPEIARRDREHIVNHGTTNHYIFSLFFPPPFYWFLLLLFLCCFLNFFFFFYCGCNASSSKKRVGYFYRRCYRKRFILYTKNQKQIKEE